MKSNEYSWHLRKTEISLNISACSTAPGALQTWVSTSSKLGPGHPVPVGHLPACAAQPREPAKPCQQPRAPPEPRGSPPSCLVPARLQLWGVEPWPRIAASPQQGKRTRANATHTQLPQQSYSCVSRLPWPMSCYLLLILANDPKERKRHTSGHVGTWVSTAAPLCMVHPCPASHMQPLYNLLCTHGQGQDWETTRSSMAGMHEGIPGSCRLPVAPGAPVAKGQDNYCPHTVRMKHWFIA